MNVAVIRLKFTPLRCMQMNLTEIEDIVEKNELLPEQVAREQCVLVIAIEGESLTLACPDTEFGATERDNVEFIMSREITWETFPKDEIELAIKYAYGSEGQVVGCTWKFNFECPKKWDELEKTEEQNVRDCKTCSRPVFLCTNTEDVVHNAKSGNCVCIVTTFGESLGDVILQEFSDEPIDFSGDIDPQNTG